MSLLHIDMCIERIKYIRVCFQMLFLSLVRITDYFFLFFFSYVPACTCLSVFLHFSPMDSLKVNFALLLGNESNFLSQCYPTTK